MAALTPSHRARAVAESVTLAITARAAELRAAGKDVVSLSAGEPDFPTPEPVAAAGIEAIRSGNTRYTATSGIPALRSAAAAWFGREFGLRYGADEVMVTAGAKAGLTMALTTILEPGQRVGLLAPYWVSYPDLVSVAGGEPIALPPVPEQGFVHTGAQIDEAARRHDLRGLILNFPNNPSGAVPSRQQITELVEAALDHDLWIISDEIYTRVVYEGVEVVSPASFPAARERTLVVNGATKSHSFTGWRLAFLAGPAEVIAAAGRIQSQTLGNPCTISQAAALVVCQEDLEEDQRHRIAAFDERRRYLVDEIATVPMLQLAAPRGAFYALVDARELCARLGVDDLALGRRLLDEELLAVVPGSAFAIPGFIRLSYAASPDTLREAMVRLRRFVASNT